METLHIWGCAPSSSWPAGCNPLSRLEADAVNCSVDSEMTFEQRRCDVALLSDDESDINNPGRVSRDGRRGE